MAAAQLQVGLRIPPVPVKTNRPSALQTFQRPELCEHSKHSESPSVAPATLFKHLLNLHFFLQCQQLPITLQRRFLLLRNTAARWKRRAGGRNGQNRSCPSACSLLMKGLIERRMTNLTNRANHHTPEWVQKPQTRQQRPGITVTFLLPVKFWQHHALQMETLGK